MASWLSPFERPTPRVVGSASEEKKKALQETVLDRFGEKHYERMPRDLREKLERSELATESFERAAITEANAITNDLLSEVGLPMFDVSERNIHFVRGIFFADPDERAQHMALTYQPAQAVVINRELFPGDGGRVNEVSTILHELLHLKGFVSFQADEETYDEYRGGLRVASTLKRAKKTGLYTRLGGLNEALVTELEKRNLPRLLEGIPDLEAERTWLQSEEAEEIRGCVALSNGVPADEIAWVDKNGESYSRFAYYEHRQVLSILVRSIYEDQRRQFGSEEEVTRLLIRSHFTGKLLDLARLIERSFGEGSFRFLAMMTVEPESAKAVLGKLQEIRQHQR